MRPERRAAWSGLGPLAACALALGGCRAVPPAPLDAERAARALEERMLSSAALRAFAFGALGEALPEAREAWSERALVAAALYYQPSIAEAAARVREAQAAVESASARTNPTLSLVPEYSLDPGPGESPWAPGLVIDWPIRTAGKRADAIDRATAQALEAHYALAAEIVAVERAVRLARVELEAAEATIQGLGQEARVHDEIAHAWRRRIELGAASRAQAAPALSAALEASGELASARARALSAESALAAAIGIPRAALGEVTLSPLAVAPSAPPDREQRRTALARRADVLAALAAYAASEAALQLEVAKQFPDLRLGPGYQWDQGQSKWQVGISLELPIGNRNQGPIREAIAAREGAAAHVTAVQTAALAEIDAASAAAEGAAAERELLAQSAEQLGALAERSQDALAAGAASRLDALSAEAVALRAARGAREAVAARSGRARRAGGLAGARAGEPRALRASGGALR